MTRVSKMNKTIHAIVKGNVQGVGFRATAFEIANQLKIKGTVSNLSDGSVEIIAQGEEKQLEELIKRLVNHFSNHIAEIKRLPISNVEHFDKFAIKGF
jgi:acylphosphatase